jgi:CAAX protease family protein
MQRKRDSSVLPFFVLVFVLCLPFWALGAINPIQLLPGLPLSALGAFAPGLAAIILSYRSDGLAGLLQLLKRSFDFKRIENKYWLLLILFINPAIAVCAYGVLRALSQPLPIPILVPLAILAMFLSFFIAALGEELGWTAYATEPLQERWGTLNAGLLLGVVWAVVHFIPLMQVHRSVEWIAWWSLGTVALRVIMTWLYIQAGKSVFAATLFHTMINLCWQLFPINGSFYDPRVFGLITLGFAIIMYAMQRFLPAAKLRTA